MQNVPSPKTTTSQSENDLAAAIRPASDVIARKFGEAAVLVRLPTNSIYELNATGARIWELLSSGQTRAEVVEALQLEFDIDAASVNEAVDGMLEVMRAEGLIQ